MFSTSSSSISYSRFNHDDDDNEDDDDDYVNDDDDDDVSPSISCAS